MVVEGVEVFGFDDIETAIHQLKEGFQDLVLCDRLTFLFVREAASPLVDTKCFRMAVWPNPHTAIGDHGQGEG